MGSIPYDKREIKKTVIIKKLVNFTGPWRPSVYISANFPGDSKYFINQFLENGKSVVGTHRSVKRNRKTM